MINYSTSPFFQAGNTLYDQVVTRESTRLIEATDIHFASKRNPKRLRAVDSQFCQRYQRRVDGQGELDRQLWGNNRC